MLNQQDAQRLIKETGFLLLLNAPEGLELGIDNISWKTGAKFKGVKLIPYGAHLVFYSLKSEGHLFKMGFFTYFSPQKRVEVRRWSPDIEDFIPLSDADERDRYEIGVINMDFDQSLGPYPQQRHAAWREVSNYITQSTVTRLQQNKEQVLAAIDFPSEQKQNQQQKIGIDEESDEGENQDDDDDKKAGVEEKEEEPTEKAEQCNINETNKQDKKESQEQKTSKDIGGNEYRQIHNTLNFSLLPIRRGRHGVVGAQLTELNLDKSQTLLEWIQSEFAEDSSELFAELQGAFAHFLLVECLDSFEHWKQMMGVLLCCEQAMRGTSVPNARSTPLKFDSKKFFVEFIPVLYAQLRQFPQDFFNDILSKDSFLRSALQDFLQSAQQCTSDNPALAQRAKKLQKMLQEHFLFFPKIAESKAIVDLGDHKYQFEDCDEEDPVIVDLEQPYYDI